MRSAYIDVIFMHRHRCDKNSEENEINVVSSGNQNDANTNSINDDVTSSIKMNM